eukprot:2663721-Amphidinium_carterae.1
MCLIPEACVTLHAEDSFASTLHFHIAAWGHQGSRGAREEWDSTEAVREVEVLEKWDVTFVEKRVIGHNSSSIEVTNKIVVNVVLHNPLVVQNFHGEVLTLQRGACGQAAFQSVGRAAVAAVVMTQRP